MVCHFANCILFAVMIIPCEKIMLNLQLSASYNYNILILKCCGSFDNFNLILNLLFLTLSAFTLLYQKILLYIPTFHYSQWTSRTKCCNEGIGCYTWRSLNRIPGFVSKNIYNSFIGKMKKLQIVELLKQIYNFFLCCQQNLSIQSAIKRTRLFSGEPSFHLNFLSVCRFR